MKYTLFLILILISMPSAYCQAPSSCLAPGGKVEMRFPMQDQDGLGTCYANSAALLLQGALQTSQPISYHQLALFHSVAVNRKELVITHGGSAPRYSGDGGSACKAILAAKNVGFCEASEFPLERHDSRDPAEEQAKLIHYYGTIIDQLSRPEDLNSPTDWNAFEEKLRYLLVHKQKLCQLPQQEFYERQLIERFPRFIMERIEALEATNEQQELSLWRQVRDQVLLSQDTDDGGKRWEFKGSLSESMRADIARWMIVAQSSGSGKPMSTNALREMRSPSYHLLNSVASTESLDLMKDGESEEMGKRLMGSISEAWKNCEKSIDQEILSQMKDPGTYLCKDDGLAYDAQIQELDNLASSLTRVLKDINANDYTDRALGLLKVLAPECAANMQARKEQLTQLNCKSFLLNPLMASPDLGVIARSPGGTQEQKKAAARAWVNESLCQQRPVSVSVCSEFMYHREGPLDTKSCLVRPPLDPSNKHANHAMTIVGHEIGPDGKTRYLIQNSWGTKCPIANPQSKGVECEVYSTNSKSGTGRFWIGEDLLLDNTFSLSVLQ
jgi:hypothetical protein